MDNFRRIFFGITEDNIPKTAKSDSDIAVGDSFNVLYIPMVREANTLPYENQETDAFRVCVTPMVISRINQFDVKTLCSISNRPGGTKKVDIAWLTGNGGGSTYDLAYKICGYKDFYFNCYGFYPGYYGHVTFPLYEDALPIYYTKLKLLSSATVNDIINPNVWHPSFYIDNE